jgi:FAD/FMN-containing dehydrogenase
MPEQQSGTATRRAGSADGLATALRRIVGDQHVLVDPELRVPYERDFTGRYGGDAYAVVRPADTSQVMEVLQACSAHGADVVPQGGNTGVVGGGVPRGGEVLLSLSRLANLGEVDATTGHLLVGAGATLAAVQQVAARAGWEMPLDLGARDGATIGGLVATDAGGAMALAHGTMRDRVAGLSIVLPDGRLLERLNGLAKDNAGYAWPSLMVGSEGTLGAITSVLLQLVPRRSQRLAALFAVAGPGEATQLMVALRGAVPSLEAVDVFFDEGVELVERVMDGVRLPLNRRAPCYVVVECAGATDPMEELATAVEAADELILDQAAADDTTGRRRLWQLREALPEALVRAGVPVKVDVAVPLSVIARFSRDVLAAIGAIAPAAETILWGHLGDGNVHVNVLGAERDEDAVEEAVLRLATDLGGTVSAEHGVGISKARHLGLVRSSEELALLRSLKDVIDPRGLMNPGVVLPRGPRASDEAAATGPAGQPPRG